MPRDNICMYMAHVVFMSVDIYTMKERAAQNNMFIHIKVPEVAIRLS